MTRLGGHVSTDLASEWKLTHSIFGIQHPTMIIFDLSTAFDDKVVFDTKELGRLRFEDSIVVAPGRLALGLSFDPSTVAPIASLILSVISLCVTIRREAISEQTRREWTAERLNSLLATELLKAGVPQYSILTVTNFSALLEKKESPCEVSVQDETSKEIVTLHIFYDGDVYRINPAHEKQRS